MAQGSVRLGLAAIALIVLWVVVYWWTPPPDDGLGIDFERAAETLPPPGLPLADPSPEEDTGPASGVIPPSFFIHTVRAGDTAERISQRYYGTTTHWRAVMKANPMTDFQHLRAGMSIRVPRDPANVQGVPSPSAAPAGTTPGERAPPAAVEYLVQRGDTLTGLAQRFYGRAGAWTIIRDANRDKVGQDGSKLRAGMTIVIPPAQAEAQR